MNLGLVGLLESGDYCSGPILTNIDGQDVVVGGAGVRVLGNLKTNAQVRSLVDLMRGHTSTLTTYKQTQWQCCPCSRGKGDSVCVCVCVLLATVRMLPVTSEMG